MVGFSPRHVRQAMAIVEQDDGTIIIVHFGVAGPTFTLDALIQMGKEHVVGPDITRTDPDRVIGYQLQIEGPGSMVMAGDFRTAWDFGQEHWRPPEPKDRPGLPAARAELDR